MSEQRPRRRITIRRVNGRRVTSNALELLGLALLVWGVALLSIPAALIVAGLGFVVIAQGVGE